jgi:hypothetical protein
VDKKSGGKGMDKKDQKRMAWKEKLLHEFKGYWFNVIFLTCFFGVFSNYRRLILAYYDISYEEYGISFIKALILAKVILIGEAMRLGRGFEDKPLIIPTLYKSFAFTLFVAIFSLVEHVVRSLFGGKDISTALTTLPHVFTYEWFAQLIVVFFVFIPFFGVRELGRVLGTEHIRKLFFYRNQ